MSAQLQEINFSILREAKPVAWVGHYSGWIWRYRHFCLNLAFADLRARFRRTHLGILWAMLQPLLLTLVMATVLNFIFKQPFAAFFTYVFSGMVMWDLFTSSINVGATAFVSAEGYIRSLKLPSAIYPLKTVINCLVVSFCGMTGFLVCTLIAMPNAFDWKWIFIIVYFLQMMIFCMPIAIICSIINLKYRDFQQAIGIVLQMLWYLSPVFIVQSVFQNPGLRQFNAFNPIAALLGQLRNPILYHTIPGLHDYAVPLIYAAGFWLVALAMLRRDEDRIVFWF